MKISRWNIFIFRFDWILWLTEMWAGKMFVIHLPTWDLSGEKKSVKVPVREWGGARERQDEKVLLPMGPGVVREHTNYAATEKRRRPLQTWPWWQVNNIFTIYFQLKSREIKNYKTFHSPRSPISMENFKLVRKSLTNWICFLQKIFEIYLILSATSNEHFASS